jgi:hypothetical protein
VAAGALRILAAQCVAAQKVLCGPSAGAVAVGERRLDGGTARCCRGTKRVTDTTPHGPDVQVGIRGDRHADDVICRCIWSIGEISLSAADGLDGLSDPAATIGE